MKILAFDIWGDYGHFRKFYTTSSPLTFSFPPPSTIKGIIGAILGIDKTEYLKVFNSQECKVSVRLINPIKKIRIGLNLINTKDGYWIPFKKKHHEPRTQIRTEFLKDPHFRLYFTHTNKEIFDKFTNFLKEHKSVYTVSLGLSELIADFEYIDILETEKCTNFSSEVVSPFSSSNLLENTLQIEEGKKYFKEKMPVIMNSDRIVEQYDNIIFEPTGKAIKTGLAECYRLSNEEYIEFF